MAAKKKEKLDVAGAIWALAEPICVADQLELVDVEYVKEGGEWYVRLFIDRADAPIDHACCQLVSEALSELLDERDPIPHAYYLEVSSPGIERPLKKAADFARFAGSRVRVSLYQPLDGQKEFVGTLQGLENDQILVELEGRTVAIARELVAKAALAVEF